MMDTFMFAAIALVALVLIGALAVLIMRRRDDSYGRMPLSLDDPASPMQPARPSGVDRSVQNSGAPPAPSDLSEVSTLVRQGNKIAAIRRLRELTGWGLKEAKDYVEAMPLAGAAPPPLGTPAAPGAPDLSEVYALARQGNKIAAIKRYRELTGVGLKEAKDFVDRL